MSTLDHTAASTTSAPSRVSHGGSGGGGASSVGKQSGGGYAQQVQRLTPRENLPGVTIKGVTLSAQATGATFGALEKALGPVWASGSHRGGERRGGRAEAPGPSAARRRRALAASA